MTSAPLSRCLGAAMTLMLLATLARPAAAAWSTGGNPLADSGDHDELVRGAGNPSTTLCPDGGGGIICAYVVNDLTIRVNRLDEATGNKLWGATGSDVTGPGRISGGSPVVVSDSSGGAWVAWIDNRTGAEGIYVQRFDAAGTAQFASGGLRISPSLADGFALDVTDSGELLIAFGRTEVRFQRVSLAGLLELGASGVSVSTQGPDALVISHDGADGAVIAWLSHQPIGVNPFTGLFANRVNASGTKQWGASGVTVRHATGVNVQRPVQDTDGTSSFLSWEENDGVIDVNGEALPIRAQRLTSAGAKQWGADGLVVFTPLDTPFDDTTVTAFQRMIVDADGDVVIGWLDGRDFNRVGTTGFLHRQDVYAQRLSGDTGAKQWGANGAVVDSFPGTQTALSVKPATTGGAIFVYQDFAATNDGDIHARRLDAATTRLWDRFLTPLSGTDGPQEKPSAASDGAGGVVVAWQDERNDPPNGVDVYATHRRGSDGQVVAPTITVLSPNGGEALHGFEPVPVTWTSANLGSAQVQIEYLVNGGAPQLAVGLGPNPTTDTGSFTWYVPDVVSSDVRIKVSAVGTGATDQSNAPFSVCRSLATASQRSAVSTPAQVAVGDFDENGVLDLAVHHLNGIDVLYGGGAGGDGDGTFPVDSVVATAGPTQGIATADFDEDGHLDLAYTDPTGLAVRLGNGAVSPRFGPAVYCAVAPGLNRVAIADLDADGIQDLVCGGPGGAGPSFVVLRGLGSGGVGNGTFGAVIPFSGTWTASDIVIADFNEDDALDLAFTGNPPSPGTSRMTFYLGLMSGGVPTGGFASPTAILMPGVVLHRMVSGDFDENGILDLAIAAEPGLRILIGQGTGGVGNGSFAVVPSLPLTLPQGIAAGDLDDDGHTDLVVGQGGGPPIATFYGPHPFVAGGGPSPGAGGAIVFGDFLEDGQMDAVAIEGTTLQVYTGQCASSLPTTITVTEPDPGDALSHGVASYHQFQWTKGAGVLSVDAALSRDSGVTWETVARRLTGTTYRWRIVGPDGPNVRLRVSDATVHNRFDDVDGDFAVCGPFPPPLTLAMPGKVDGVAFGDFNEDGHLDLAASTSDDLHVRLSDGAGGFGPVATIPTALGPNGIVVGDFDDDGILDLVGTTGAGIVLARGGGTAGVGNGTFLAPIAHSLSRKTTQVAAADLDEDGILDLVVVHPDQDEISVLLGNGFGGDGDGTFTATTYAVGDQPTAVAVAHLDDDGILDVAVANRGTNDVSILLGQGAAGVASGVLGPATSFPAGAAPVTLAAVDLSGDGIRDLLVTNDSATPTLSFLRGQGVFGTGNGTYAAPVGTPTIADPEALVLTDLNDDTRSDPVVLSSSRDSLVAYLTSGTFTATFTEFERRRTGDTPYTGAVADLDNDLVPDLVVGDLLAGNLEVFFGACPATPRGTLSVLAPNGGQSFEIGTNTNISWANTFAPGPVDIDVSYDGGANWEPVVRRYSQDFDLSFMAHLPWTVPPPATTAALIRICESYATTRCDVSAAVFTIAAPAVGVSPSLAPAELEFSPPRPNPSRGEASFVLALPSANRVRVEVFDILGRRVRSLSSGRLPAGWHTLRWDGRDEHGGVAGAGLYLVRALGEGFERSRRLILTR